LNFEAVHEFLGDAWPVPLTIILNFTEHFDLPFSFSAA
jgi:hypothetical protein